MYYYFTVINAITVLNHLKQRDPLEIKYVAVKLN